MNWFSRLGCAALIASALGVGCGNDAPADEQESSDTVSSTAQLTAKATGITVWVDPVAHPIVRFGQPAWVIKGRASKNLESVFSFSSDDEFGEALVVSPRKFEMYVDAPQLEQLLKGYLILLDI